MAAPKSKFPYRLVGSALLLLVLAATAYGLYLIKTGQREAAIAAAESQPMMPEIVGAEAAVTTPYARTTTAIGTVRALRSITLRNELPGTVRKVSLATGKEVQEGELLVELDVAVEEAQLAALRAEARLGETMLGRMERALEQQGASAADVDRARAERDRAEAEVRRLEALLDQKRLRAPFHARVGLVDLHVGQYLQPGTLITSLQGIDDAVHVDFPVTQEVARHLSPGGTIDVIVAREHGAVPAKIVALDASVDESTRNTNVRAELRGIDPLPTPGSSVRISVPVEQQRDVVVVPVNALRRGPSGNSVFVLEKDDQGQLRSHVRRVQSGAVLGDVVVIESGVEPGEQVASDGSFKLREGAPVMVGDASATAGGDANPN